MTESSVSTALKAVLADSYALYLKTQNYHWNVSGPHFKSLHLLFEEQYTDLALAVDAIAERIRTLGEKAPGSFAAYNALKTIEDGDEDAKSDVMVQMLADDQQRIIASLNAARKAAHTADDEVTIGMVVDRIAVHEKNAWMLRSSL